MCAFRHLATDLSINRLQYCQQLYTDCESKKILGAKNVANSVNVMTYELCDWNSMEEFKI